MGVPVDEDIDANEFMHKLVGGILKDEVNCNKILVIKYEKCSCCLEERRLFVATVYRSELAYVFKLNWN